jgi:hypothetical protein
MTLSSVPIQITPASRPSTHSWMGEVAAFAQVLSHEGILNAIQNRVRFARARFGHYDVVDCVAVLIGYAVSGEPTRAPRFTNGPLPKPRRSWPSLLETRCPIARPFPVFSQPLIRLPWKLCARADLRICLPANRFLPPLGLFDRMGG